MLIVLTLAACDTSQGIGRLFATNIAQADGPDEFSILPTKPLEQPENYTELPIPQAGGPNLVDSQPEQDAVAALGGNPSSLTSTVIRPGEGTLLAVAERRGRDTGIREVLTREDADWRANRQPRLLERWFGTDTYFRTYENQTIQARSVAEHLRHSGVRVPVAPPPEE
ncbi:MAG: DUF3035 domain-containing protein [Rhodobacteraceae bacterium]|nr:DUF3035 domain-containing protein [Paracoccaceae bacterium]